MKDVSQVLEEFSEDIQKRIKQKAIEYIEEYITELEKNELKEIKKNDMKKDDKIYLLSPFWDRAVVGFFVILLLILLSRMMFLNFVDSYEVGYKFDKRDGTLTTLDRTGWFITPPFVVSVHTVDIRPVQVCINANARVLNCKLVQFNTDGLELFLSWHGRKNYAISQISGGSSGTNSGDFVDILRSYAYSGAHEQYPFLKILKELKPENNIPLDTLNTN